MKKQAWLILCLITIVAGFALSLTNMVTTEPIAQQKLMASNAARIAVFADATGFEEQTVIEGSKVDSVYTATKDGQTVGYVLQATVNGYGGPIEIVMGIDTRVRSPVFRLVAAPLPRPLALARVPVIRSLPTSLLAWPPCPN